MTNDNKKEVKKSGMSGFRSSNSVVVRGNIGTVREFESIGNPGRSVLLISVACGGDKEGKYATLWFNARIPDEVSYIPVKGQAVEMSGFIYKMADRDRLYFKIKDYIRFYEGSLDNFNEFPIG